MVTILDLPDECLINICKRLDHDSQRCHWVDVCKRFRYIYCEYCHGTEVDDYLVQKFGHLIGTDDFPKQIIKRINLWKSECSKRFLNKLRIFHPEIEEAKLFWFTDEHMAELLPLPNLKVLICIGDYDLSGRNLIDLCRLTELHIYTNKFIYSENLIHTTYHNPLRVLVIPNDPGVFSEKCAFEMVENLKYLEELVVEYNHCKSWQLIGTLPLLKKLEIWGFVTHRCDSCAEKPDLYDTCAPNHDKILFDELRKRNQLEELIFYEGCLTDFHLNGISELRSLRILKFSGAAMPHEVSLDIFKELINLEELHLDGRLNIIAEEPLEFIKLAAMSHSLSLDTFKIMLNMEEMHIHSRRKIIAEESLEFIKNCQKLRVIHFWNAAGINANFISNANDIVSKRKSSTVKPLKLGFSFITKEMVKDLDIRTPLLHIRITTLSRKYVADVADVQRDLLKRKFSVLKRKFSVLKRKFSVMNTVAEEREVDMEIIARMAARAESEEDGLLHFDLPRQERINRIINIFKIMEQNEE